MKKRKLRRWVVVSLTLILLMSGLAFAGVWFYNAVSIQYPSNMIKVDESNKNFGKHRTYKDKTAAYFIVQHFPETGIDALDDWIVASTDEVREKIKNDVLLDAIVKEGEKPYEFFQDYASELNDNTFGAVMIRSYLNNELYDVRARVFDKETGHFSTINDLIKPLALRLLTNEARENTEMGTLSRMDYLQSVNLLNDTDNFFIKDSTFTFLFRDGLMFTKDIGSVPQYLARDLENVKMRDEALPSTYVSQGVDPSKRLVALTFDDGPHGELTLDVMNLLEKYNAHATFFVLGSRVEGRESVLIDILNRGHQLANHSWNHPNLTKLSKEDAIAQIVNTENALIKATGYDGPYYVRPPYGAINPTRRGEIKRVFVNWSVDSEDWSSKDPQTICKKIEHDTYDGSIVLMHDIQKATVQSLECTLQTLTDDGYTFVTVRELLEARDQNPTPGELYRYAPKGVQ